MSMMPKYNAPNEMLYACHLESLRKRQYCNPTKNHATWESSSTTTQQVHFQLPLQSCGWSHPSFSGAVVEWSGKLDLETIQPSRLVPLESGNPGAAPRHGADRVHGDDDEDPFLSTVDNSGCHSVPILDKSCCCCCCCDHCECRYWFDAFLWGDSCSRTQRAPLFAKAKPKSTLQSWASFGSGCSFCDLPQHRCSLPLALLIAVVACAMTVLSKPKLSVWTSTYQSRVWSIQRFPRSMPSSWRKYLHWLVPMVPVPQMRETRTTTTTQRHGVG